MPYPKAMGLSVYETQDEFDYLDRQCDESAVKERFATAGYKVQYHCYYNANKEEGVENESYLVCLHIFIGLWLFLSPRKARSSGRWSWYGIGRGRSEERRVGKEC